MIRPSGCCIWCSNDVTLSFQTNPGSVYSIMMAVLCRMQSTSSYWPIIWSDGMKCHWIHVSYHLFFPLPAIWTAAVSFQRYYGLCLYHILEASLNLCFSRIMYDGMLPILSWPSFIQNMFNYCPIECVLLISYQLKMSGQWLPSEWHATNHKSLWLINCGTVLKLHGLLYPYRTSNLYSTPWLSGSCYCYQGWLLWVLIFEDQYFQIS